MAAQEVEAAARQLEHDLRQARLQAEEIERRLREGVPVADSLLRFLRLNLADLGLL